MYVLVYVALTLFIFSGISSAAPKRDVSGDLARDRLHVLVNSVTTKWQNRDETLDKYKNDAKMAPNEVHPGHKKMTYVSRAPVTLPTVTTAMMTSSARKPSEKDSLRDWVASIPSNMFNMKNRVKLAAIFLEAHTKDDVMKKLARATGRDRLRHGGRHLSRGRKLRRRWPVPYHPTVRFMAIRANSLGRQQ